MFKPGMEEEAEEEKILLPINGVLLTACKGTGNPCVHKLENTKPVN